MKILAKLGLAFCLVASFSVAAGELTTRHPGEAHFNVTLPSRTVEPVLLNAAEKQEMLARDLDYLIAPIKSMKDLNALLARNEPSALDALSGPARKRFVSSLAFNDRGVTQFDYRDLEAELTPSQTYQVLAMFGLQSAAAWVGYARVETALDKDMVEMIGQRSSGKCGVIIQDGGDGPGGKAQAKCTDGPPFRAYECTAKGTCSSAPGKICTANC